MRARALFLKPTAHSFPLSIILLLPATLQAESWQIDPEIGIRAADVYISSRDPADQYGSTLKALRGTVAVKRADETSLWQNSLTVETAQANESPYGETRAQSHYNLQEKLSSTQVDLAYRHSHGYDPIAQPIEEASARDARSFDSLNGGVFQQYAYDLRNEFSLYLGLGRNSEGPSRVETKDGQLSWDHHHSVAWTSRLKLRITDADNRLQEWVAEHLFRFDKKLSGAFSYGYGWQEGIDGKSDGGLLWGASLQYETSGLIPSANAYASLAPAKEITVEQSESLRGSSLYQLGWTHSRDQRRVGDPFYYANVFYGLARIELPIQQSLQLKGSESHASEQKLLESWSDYRAEIFEGRYAWAHRFFSRIPDARLSLSYSAERTRLAPRRYFREIYQLNYDLVW